MCQPDKHDSKVDFIAKFKRASDLIDEARLVMTILHYARSGHATPLMVEQAIVLVEKHIVCANEENDVSLLKSSMEIKVGLEQALREGVSTLRVKKAPNPETVQVEEPMARMRRAAGHNVRRQLKCARGVIDIYDLTADELIECKLRGTSAALGEAAGQLQRYRKSFPGASLTIAVLSIEAEAQWLADLLRSQGFSIVELARGGS